MAGKPIPPFLCRVMTPESILLAPQVTKSLISHSFSSCLSVSLYRYLSICLSVSRSFSLSLSLCMILTFYLLYRTERHSWPCQMTGCGWPEHGSTAPSEQHMGFREVTIRVLYVEQIHVQNNKKNWKFINLWLHIFLVKPLFIFLYEIRCLNLWHVIKSKSRFIMKHGA